jgi:hypothetical protein
MTSANSEESSTRMPSNGSVIPIVAIVRPTIATQSQAIQARRRKAVTILMVKGFRPKSQA